MKNALLMNAGALAILISGTILFDRSLELGQLHGVVFRLYTFYGSIGMFLINICIALWFFLEGRRRQAIHICFAGSIVAATGVLLAFAF